VVELLPGKELDLHELHRQLRPASESDVNKVHTALYATGKVGVRYEQVLGAPEMSRPGWKLDPTLSTLATGRLELDVREAAKQEQRVFTPDDLLRSAAALAAGEQVVVQFKVRLVQPSVAIRNGVAKEAGWVAGHGPGDLGLHPQDRLDYTRDQFAAVLTAKATQQLQRLGIQDAGEHLQGKTIRVTGVVSSYLPFTDDPPCGRQFDLMIDDVSQLAHVE
jgi:hypothetical protein